MFNSSVRRAVCAAQPSPFVSAIANASAPRAISTQTLALRPLQRRYSSSKPSSPADGPKGVADVPAPAQVKADGAKKKAKAQRKAKDNTIKGREEIQGLPSVPSTGHLQVKEIAASSFFSLHRPISVTAPFPKSITDDAFAAIFAPRTRANRVTDVLSTLSSSVESLEQQRWNAEADQLRSAINSDSDVTHLDGMPGDGAIPFPQHIMQGRYQPFNAPPAPVPMDSAESLAAGLEATVEEVQHKTYTATLTIEESTDVNGEITYTAHSSPLLDVEVEEPSAPRSFAERMQQRRQSFEEGREEQGTWQAISVKRQRKLKMKKHKYKKLMRRTRNLRRRLDRN